MNNELQLCLDGLEMAVLVMNEKALSQKLRDEEFANALQYLEYLRKFFEEV